MRPAVVIGAASAIAFCVGVALGGGSATVLVPEPTPKIITTTKVVEIPQPQPTPLVVTREVEVSVPVTPPDCMTAMDAGDDMVTSWVDWLDAMSNGKWAKADRMSEAAVDAVGSWYDASDRCRSQGAGS